LPQPRKQRNFSLQRAHIVADVAPTSTTHAQFFDISVDFVRLWDAPSANVVDA